MLFYIIYIYGRKNATQTLFMQIPSVHNSAWKVYDWEFFIYANSITSNFPLIKKICSIKDWISQNF